MQRGQQQVQDTCELQYLYFFYLKIVSIDLLYVCRVKLVFHPKFPRESSLHRLADQLLFLCVIVNYVSENNVTIILLNTDELSNSISVLMILFCYQTISSSILVR